MYNDSQIDPTFFEQLNKHISLNASTFVGIFKKNDIERRDRNFKLIDNCSDFSLSVESSYHSHLGCSNDFAIFTIAEQKTVKHHGDYKHTVDLVITIKCYYKNYKGLLSTFSFQVVVDYDVSKQGYFHHISVNSNGTILLIHSQTTCVVSRVPVRVSASSLLSDEKTTLQLLQGIKVVELDEGCNIVKAMFSCKHPNVFCLVSMESLDIAGNGNYSLAKLAHKNNFEIFNDYMELFGVIRMFDVESSIDTPILSMKLSEEMCRLGRETYDTPNRYERKRLKIPGAIVDLFWNENDTSHIGSLTLFVLSNYGLVFAYSPVIVDTHDNFNTKLKLVEKSLDLLEKGFIFDGNQTSMDTKSDVIRLLKSLYIRKNSVENVDVELFPTIVKLEIDTKRSVSYSNSSFESFTVLSTYPELIIIASTFDGSISVFKSSSLLVPQTSHFFNPNTFRNLHYIDSFDMLGNSCFKGSKISFIPISPSTCLLYSLYESFILTFSNVLKITPILKNTKVGDFLYYFSQPTMYLKPGENRAEYSRAENRNLFLLFPYYCYIRDYEILKYDSIIARTMNLDSNTSRIDEDDFVFRCPSIKSGSQVDINSYDNELLKKSSRVPEYVLSSYKKFSDSFNGLKICISDKAVFKQVSDFHHLLILFQKIIRFIRIISSADSDTLQNIKTGSNYGEMINKMRIVNEDIVNSIDLHFNNNFKLYSSMFEDLKTRINSARDLNQTIIIRHEGLIRLISRIRELQIINSSMISISNMITSVYLKHSSRLLEDMTRKANESRNFDNDSLKELISLFKYNIYKICR
ncbi:hypothetical protein BEWA_007860 [Theileria equi strain WA]|uniref:Uncharacterized protein n=1 Tax=Theileria equi strain WA TaxID=1537102 RepID=L0B0L4_THEEQ|nr:hypothetical protein BEWA_007860 [Theileria equi strain WA]AFZ81377.1 hypothetical protein BEWA_007860 [Theileria equi strain WA]|eukprot:XP_004831043.1 hypothetical protein BEWA_007860 [Theileria equi strain WA]